MKAAGHGRMYRIARALGAPLPVALKRPFWRWRRFRASIPARQVRRALDAGRFAQASKLAHASVSRGGSQQVLWRVASTCMGAQAYVEAIAALRVLSEGSAASEKASKRLVGALRLHAQALEVESGAAGALPVYREAFALAIEHGDETDARLGRRYARTLVAVVQSLLARDDREGAARLVTEGFGACLDEPLLVRAASDAIDALSFHGELDAAIGIAVLVPRRGREAARRLARLLAERGSRRCEEGDGTAGLADYCQALAHAAHEPRVRRLVLATLRQHVASMVEDGDDPVGAADVLEDLLCRAPDDLPLRNLATDLVPALTRLGREKLARREDTGAVEILRRAASMGDADGELPGRALGEAVSECLAAGELDRAEHLLLESIRVAPDLRHLGSTVSAVLDAAAQVQRDTEATRELRLHLSGDLPFATSRSELLQRRGDVLMARGRHEAAVRSYTEALALSSARATDSVERLRDALVVAAQAVAAPDVSMRDPHLGVLALETAKQRLPDDLELRDRLEGLVERQACSARERKDYEAAAHFSLRIVELAGPEPRSSAGRRAVECALRVDAPDRGIPLLQRILALRLNRKVVPRLGELLSRRAAIHDRSGNFEAAVADYRAARALPEMRRRIEQDARLRAALGRVRQRWVADLLAAGDATGACAEATSALADEPEDPRSRALCDRVVRAAITNGEDEVVVDVLQAVLDASPDDGNVAHRLVQGYERVARAALRRGDADVAVKSYRRARDLEGGHVLAAPIRAARLGRALLAWSAALDESGRHEDAVAALQEAAKVAWGERGVRRAVLRYSASAGRDQRFEAALSLLRSVGEDQPGDPVIRSRSVILFDQRARVRARSGDLEGAISDLRDALSLSAAGSGSSGDGATRALRLGSRLQQLLLRQAHVVTRERGPVAGRAILEEAAALGASDAVTSRLAELEQLPTIPFADYSTPLPGPSGTTLVLVEDHVDEALLRVYLDALGTDIEVVAHSRLRSAAYIPSILDSGSVGLAGDMRVVARTDALSGRVRELLQGALLDHIRNAEHLDLIEQMSFVFDDLAFAVGRKLALYAQLLRSRAYSRVVFVVGNSDVALALWDVAVEATGEGHVYRIWCSKAHRRFEPIALAEPPTRPGPPRVAPRPEAVAASGLLPWLLKEVPAEATHLSQPGAYALLVQPAMYARNVAPIARKLAERGAVTVVPALAMRPEHDYGELLEEGAGAKLSVRHVAPPPTPIDAREREAVEEAIANLAAHPEIRALNLDGALFWKLYEPGLRRALVSALPRVRRFAERFARYLDHERPRALVVCPDRSSEARIGCALARQRGIVSVSPQATLLSDSARYKPVQADIATVHDDHVVRQFVRNGWATPERLVVTGISRFDGIHERRRASDRAVRNGKGDPKSVVLALQRFSIEQTAVIITVVGAAVERLPTVRLNVRLHPGEPPVTREQHRAVVASLPGADRIVVTEGGDLYETLACADLVVGIFSTSLLEAAMLDRLVLSISLFGQPSPVPFVEQGIAIGVEGRDAVASAVERGLYDADFIESARALRHAYFDRNPHLLAAPAAELIADVVTAAGALPLPRETVRRPARA